MGLRGSLVKAETFRPAICPNRGIKNMGIRILLWVTGYGMIFTTNVAGREL